MAELVGVCSRCGLRRPFASEDDWWAHHDHYVVDDSQPHGSRWCGEFALIVPRIPEGAPPQP